MHFSKSELAKSFRAGDSQRFGTKIKINREAILNDALALSARSIDFSLHNKVRLNGNIYASFPDLPTNLVLRTISRFVAQATETKFPDREFTVRSVIQSLLDGTPTYLFRRDITSFYENVPLEKVRTDVVRAAETSPIVRQHIEQFISQFGRPAGATYKTHGLPRGISISAVLSELSLKSFDRTVGELPGIYRYFRYTDDILIFAYMPHSELDDKIAKALPSPLAFNKSKFTNIEIGSSKSSKIGDTRFDYLGYSFEAVITAKGKLSTRVIVRISEKKIKKLKSRIILSLKSFRTSGDFKLLRDRIRFLSGNYWVLRRGVTYRPKNPKIRSGIYYNYRMCGEYQFKNDGRSPISSAPQLIELKMLDGFYQSLLKGRTSKFASYLNANLSSAQLTELKSMSFYRGYVDRIMIRVTPLRVGRIKEAWRHA